MPDRSNRGRIIIPIMNPHALHDQLLSPHESFTALRQPAPVYNTDLKVWEISTYDEVHYIASEHEIFSSDEVRFTTDPAGPALQSILNSDPPRHRQLRSLVTQAFTPRAIAQLAPRISSITNELLDKVVGQGKMDIVDDLSYPLPIIVIAEMLGVSTADRPRFKRWSDDLVSGEYDQITSENLEEVTQQIRTRVRHTMDEINDYFRHVLVERRQHPGDDLISALLAAQIDGESLTEQDLLGFCALLLVAGNITTTNLIGNALLCFDEHPEVMDRLRQHPDLIPSAIEEVLRYRSPITALGRFVATDVVLKDQQIKAGEFIIAWVACANHDPAQFAHPERFDIERNPNRHVSFGHGIHFCLGAPLARLETKIALNIMLNRITNIQRVRDRALDPVNSTFIYGARHVPITFSAC